MAGSENTSNFQGSRIEGTKLVKDMTNNKRRALGNINPNIIGPCGNPCVVKKKEVSGNDMIKPAILSRRPNTRSVLTQQIQLCSKPKKVTSLAASSNTSEACESETKKNCENVDMVEVEDANDGPVPMSVNTQAVKEVEMVDVEQEETVIDIDGSSWKDPLSVVEYVNDMYAHYRETESSSCVSPDYMVHQPELNKNMRAILIDWLIEVHYKFELREETLFLTVNLIDRYLDCQEVTRKTLQLLGITALLLACKYEEVHIPDLDDFVAISDKAYTRDDVLDMENSILKALQFNFSVPTPFVFMRRFLKAAQSDEKLEHLSFYITELSLVEYEMLRFPPSLLAAAAIFTAQCCLYRSKQWNKTTEWYTKYSEDQLLECSKLMVTYHQNAGKGKLTGVYRKHLKSKYCIAAKAEPAEFLLEDY
ncbi:hypothetical protein UlMin_032102 [Ulmus minor]